MLSDAGRSELTGRRLGPYVVQAAIGSGGMGEVYRAHDTNLGRDVAIKVLPSAFTGDPERLARFEREARVLAALNHPNIGAIYGVERGDGVRALVLELVEGETLADRVARGPVPVAEAVAIAGQIVDALDAAHERGVVHRDLKPANICLLLAFGDWVKVLDFGLAKTVNPNVAQGSGMYPMPGSSMAPDESSSFDETLDSSLDDAIDAANEITLGGVLLGTPMYMAPEAIYGEAVDARSDLYSLGCILYELLVGLPPFWGESTAVVLARQLDDPPPPLPDEIPPTLRQLVTALLAKLPEQRPANALTVRAVLEHCLASEMVGDMATLLHAALPDRDEKP